MLYSEDGELMPLTFADPGVENIIKKIGGNSEVRAHLENLGFVVGGTVWAVRGGVSVGGDVRDNVRNGVGAGVCGRL